jgi:hypothetical protein
LQKVTRFHGNSMYYLHFKLQCFANLCVRMDARALSAAMRIYNCCALRLTGRLMSRLVRHYLTCAITRTSLKGNKCDCTCRPWSLPVLAVCQESHLATGLYLEAFETAVLAICLKSDLMTALYLQALETTVLAICLQPDLVAGLYM